MILAVYCELTTRQRKAQPDFNSSTLVSAVQDEDEARGITEYFLIVLEHEEKETLLRCSNKSVSPEWQVD